MKYISKFQFSEFCKESAFGTTDLHLSAWNLTFSFQPSIVASDSLLWSYSFALSSSEDSLLVNSLIEPVGSSAANDEFGCK